MISYPRIIYQPNMGWTHPKLIPGLVIPSYQMSPKSIGYNNNRKFPKNLSFQLFWKRLLWLCTIKKEGIKINTKEFLHVKNLDWSIITRNRIRRNLFPLPILDDKHKTMMYIAIFSQLLFRLWTSRKWRDRGLRARMLFQLSFNGS